MAKIAISTGILIFGIYFFISGASLAEQRSKVKIIDIKGDVKILEEGAAEWIEAGIGMELSKGDRIKTSHDSYAVISFDRKNANTVRVGEKTDVYIRLKDKEKIELIDGELLSHVTKIPRGRRFEIRTPAAVCGARGTGWRTGHTDRTEIDVFEEKVYVRGIDKRGKPMEKEFWIDEGFRRVVERFEKPSRIMELSNRDYDKWNTWKKDKADALGREYTPARRREETAMEPKRLEGVEPKIAEGEILEPKLEPRLAEEAEKTIDKTLDRPLERSLERSLERTLERKTETYEKFRRERIDDRKWERKDEPPPPSEK